MEIISKSIHVIDYNEKLVYPRDIPETFNGYVIELLKHINANTAVRNYKTRSQATQIVVNAKNILKKIIEKDLEIEKYFKDNADRLLRKEIEVQDAISRLNKKIQKGSLIQSLIFDNNTKEYIFLLAKVEHSEFVDDIDFSYKTGFSKNKKDIWKSCILYFNDAIDLEINNAKVHSNTVAKYWSYDFLELDEMLSDEVNTLNAFRAIEETLARNIKSTAPKDYTVIRNTVIAYFKRDGHLDYNVMVEDILGAYQPADLTNDKIQTLRDKLINLPEKRNFDVQFNSVPAVINAKIKKIYSVNRGIEIKITDCIEDIENIIKSVEEPDGNRYLKIRTNNDITFNLFK